MELKELSCTNCGAKIEVDILENTVKCIHCNSTFYVDSSVSEMSKYAIHNFGNLFKNNKTLKFILRVIQITVIIYFIFLMIYSLISIFVN
ncbi:MAG: hypothetical protein R3Y13_05915 [bacterium]